VRFTQYYLGCLSQASYLIGDETTGRAAVVDPRRDVGEYLEAAAAAGLRIEYVIETHVHADFLSGHLELAAATGATVIYGGGRRRPLPAPPGRQRAGQTMPALLTSTKRAVSLTRLSSSGPLASGQYSSRRSLTRSRITALG
jgi:hydroxyacylglutathione hydrolase